jgi:membrane fusion protein (multidrug efflux system)
MGKKPLKYIVSHVRLLFFFVVLLALSVSVQAGDEKDQGPPPTPVRVAKAIQDSVSDQITLVGSTEAIASSVVAAEVSGLVTAFPVREGDFVKKGDILVRLRATDLELRLKAAMAAAEEVRANLAFAEKELNRHTKLKGTDSIAERKYDEVFYHHKSLQQKLLETEADIDLLKDDIQKKTVFAPFSGFVAEEHTQVGEWVTVGGEIVTLVDLSSVKISVDVPERYAVQLRPKDSVFVVVGSVSNEMLPGEIFAVLPEGDPNARTFPVHVMLKNPDLKIRGGMEARVQFNLGIKKDALLVPKDAIVSAGGSRLVFIVSNGVARPVNVQIIGYFDGNVAIEGPVMAGDQVVIRGNERLMPGQAVKPID